MTSQTTSRIPVKDRPLKKNQIRLNTVEILKAANEIKAKTGDRFSMRLVALHFMPDKYRYFENGADWDFTFWLTNVLEASRAKGKHLIGIYTFPKQGRC